MIEIHQYLIMKKTTDAERDLHRRLMTVSGDAALKLIQEELGLQRNEAETYYKSLKRRNETGFILAGSGFILIGLLLIGTSIFYRVRNSEINRGMENTGIVTRVVTVTIGEGSTRIVDGYRHTFEYEINGTSYKTKSRANAGVGYEKDVDIPIMVSNRNPKWAEVLNVSTGKVYTDPPGYGWGLLLTAAGSLALAAVRYQRKGFRIKAAGDSKVNSGKETETKE
jgi:hypothetical protein